jgi:hypothetical protein
VLLHARLTGVVEPARSRVRLDEAALTDERVARITADVQPTIEAVLKVLGHLPRDGHVRIVDGQLDLPPALLQGWLIRHTIKRVADRVLGEDSQPPLP